MSTLRENMQRKKAFEDSLNGYDIYFDNWTREGFFNSRVNHRGLTIAPMSVSTMRPISQQVITFNFVADAFEDLRSHYRNKLSTGLVPYGNLIDLSPVSGYIKPKHLYSQHEDKIVNIFFEKYIRPNSESISGFFEFMDYFMQFVNDYAHSFPILYSSFVRSHLCPLASNALMINFMEDMNNNDQKRAEFVDHPTYEIFNKMAVEYGFVVPKWSPWSVYANLDSDIMLSYAIQYDIQTKEDIYDEYYEECKDSDIDLLQGYILEMYNSFMFSYITLSNPKICKDGTYKSQRRSRIDVGIDNLEVDPVALLSDLYWYEIYIKILLAENKLKIPNIAFDILLKDCYYLLNKFDFSVSYAHLKNKIEIMKEIY
tara:strand:+ start:503 stop:1612 length:1110 start_codon:yes stop_codon:yes gene_type:complete